MRRYAVKLTIEGMLGAFAEKYARTIDDAQFLHALIEEKLSRKAGPHLELLAAREEPEKFDPYPLFPKMMKLLRWAAHDRANQLFFTGVRFESESGEPGSWEAEQSARDDEGDLTVRAFGSQVLLTRAASDAVIELTDAAPTVSVQGGLLRWRSGTWREQFYGPLQDVIAMCEETMAKGQPLIATTVMGSEQG